MRFSVGRLGARLHAIRKIDVVVPLDCIDSLLLGVPRPDSPPFVVRHSSGELLGQANTPVMVTGSPLSRNREVEAGSQRRV